MKIFYSGAYVTESKLRPVLLQVFFSQVMPLLRFKLYIVIMIYDINKVYKLLKLEPMSTKTRVRVSV